MASRSVGRAFPESARPRYAADPVKKKSPLDAPRAPAVAPAVAPAADRAGESEGIVSVAQVN